MSNQKQAMRISTQQMYNIANIGMADAQRAITKTEEQIASGKRVVNPSDDPIASTKILQLQDTIARGEQYKKNIDIAENSLELEETTLDSVLNLLTRMQELAVQSGNSAVLTESDYKAIASEVDARLEQLLGLANTRNSNGDYLFAGYQGNTQPFEVDGGGGYHYRGDEGSLSLKVSSTTAVQVSDSGKKVFQDIPSAFNTVHTSANSANRSSPPINISVGRVVDQQAFDEFYPKDMQVTFNDPDNITPAGANYTITERASGRVIVADQPYQQGEDIEINGVSFRINGTPYPGEAAIPGTLAFATDAAQNFAGDETGESLTLRVGNRTETLTIGSDVANDADLVTELTSGANGDRLANLGITINTGTTPPQFEVASGLNVTVDPNGSSGANVLAALGVNSGTASTDGEQAVAGDQLFIESSDSQGVLTTLSRFSEALHQVRDGDTDSREAMEDVVASTLASLDKAETRINSVQSEIGARLNTLESSREMHEDTELYNNEVLSDLRDLDWAEASTRLSLQSFILQATQQSFVKVSGLSLFSLLR